jgi:hypothetical protein
MDAPSPQPEPQPLGAAQPSPELARQQPSAMSRARRGLLLGALIIAAGIGTGYVLLGQKARDDISQADRQAMLAAAATAVLTPQRVDLANPQEVEKARQALDLPPPQADQLVAAARQGKPQLAWIILRDFADEDGDVAEISTGGLTRTVTLTTAPQTVAVPLVPGDFLRVKGINEGAGGGVTVAVIAGGAEVKLPLQVGQTVSLPLK